MFKYVSLYVFAATSVVKWSCMETDT